MTAVEFLSEQIRLCNIDCLRFQLWDSVEQAKEMEKQQQGYSEKEVLEIVEQAAVEWLTDELNNIKGWTKNDIILSKADILIEQAKEMEKQQQGYSEEDMLKSYHCGKLYQGREGDTTFQEFLKNLNK